MTFSRKVTCPYCGASDRIPAEYEIRSIPTMILFQQGKEVARHSGAMMAGDLERWIEDQLTAQAA